MRNLFEFLLKYYYWFLFFVLEIISFILLFQFNNYQGNAFFTAANEGIAQIQGIYYNILSFTHLNETNEELMLHNTLLQQENNILRQKLQTYERDTTLIEHSIQKQLKDFSLIKAEVITCSTKSVNNYIVINKGSKDSIQPEMGVISGNGIVGTVYLTSEHYSLVVPIINSKSSISCRVRHQNFFGYLKWEGGNAQKARVNDIPRYAQISSNDTIETSGYSTIFPAGLYVGKVEAVKESPDGLSYYLETSLGTKFSTLRNVIVVTNKNKPEIDSLFTKIE